MSQPPRSKLHLFERHTPQEMLRRAEVFRDTVSARRSVRHFSSEPVPEAVVLRCIEAAASSPSGANKQPWTFVLVTDPALKAQIRGGAETEEEAFYGGRAGDRWLEDLEPLGTDASKPFLEEAPALIAVFAQRHGEVKDDRHYYVNESVGIAVGVLLAALQHAGLASLTHTPSPMGFLGRILERPKSERAYLLIPVGYPAEGCEVPDIGRKGLAEVLVRK